MSQYDLYFISLYLFIYFESHVTQKSDSSTEFTRVSNSLSNQRDHFYRNTSLCLLFYSTVWFVEVKDLFIDSTDLVSPRIQTGLPPSGRRDRVHNPKEPQVHLFTHFKWLWTEDDFWNRGRPVEFRCESVEEVYNFHFYKSNGTVE